MSASKISAHSSSNQYPTLFGLACQEVLVTNMRALCYLIQDYISFLPPMSSVQWGSWSSCSVSCGGRGRRRRTRAQSGPDCTRKAEEAKECTTNLCPVDCRLSPWGPWSPCSSSCGQGMRSRSRSQVQAAEHWGAECPTNREHLENCVEEDCPVDGAWTSWAR